MVANSLWHHAQGWMLKSHATRVPAHKSSKWRESDKLLSFHLKGDGQ